MSKLLRPNRKKRQGIFHVHSSYSSDAKLTLQQLKAECVDRNLEFMILTDHAEDFDTAKMSDFVANCTAISEDGFLAVPGLEFVIDADRDVHLLACGLTQLPKEHSADAIIDDVQKAGGICVIAHPSRNNHYVPAELVGMIDGIEIWNAAYDSRYVPDVKALRLLKTLRNANSNLLGYGGLDLHDKNGFRGLSIVIQGEFSNESELLTCLKRGRFSIRGGFLRISPECEVGRFRLRFFSLARFGVEKADALRWKARTWKSALRQQGLTDSGGSREP